ncbi:hypothetical protein PHYSODRAFT_326142 [Phytophthora sojae]|uniref:Uncharacterized protein n=1 Tax=Phytophthora sojae (strain P6497) TaxID=1094619 RepID=G4YXT0_PHYSP|nr:hypothetical protein PHYSODRAFT_326142 [Phytophthora sojae]EGZ25073.1 hypothetical protein PHYSODRAFT_326142 [Phytophthora sojae]|eukprot:XP_009520361.1 hypothetical protein PHYSODRAFT_326142 [Phytophthora sojae]
MGKTPERRVFASAPLRYRRKVPVPEDNQQPEPTQQQLQRKQQQQQPYSHDRSSKSPPARRFRPKGGRQPKHRQQQQPPLLKQLLWKAKAVQPMPESLGIRPLPAAPQKPQQQQQKKKDDGQEEEDEEAVFAQQQRQARKLLASEAEALAAGKQKAVSVVSPVDAFVAESSSQETQSGSEDEAVFLPYNGLPTTQWQVYAKEQQQREEEVGAGSAEETDGEEAVMPSETVDDQESLQMKEQGQDELEKSTARRRKPRQKHKLRQKQKRAAAKEQKRLQHQQKQQQQEEDHERPRSADGDSTLEDENTAVDIFHPPTNLARDMDAGLCRAVLSQLQDVVPFIVVGDVACPVVDDEQSAVSAKGGAGSDAAVVDFREHVIAMLDRSRQTQMQHRDSFLVESSGFDAASSYDFFKRRTCRFVCVCVCVANN